MYAAEATHSVTGYTNPIQTSAQSLTTPNLEHVKPNRWRLPAHTSDQARQLMAGTVFNAKDAQQVAMQHQMQGNMAMGPHSSMPNNAHSASSQMNMPHSSQPHSPQTHMQGMHGSGMHMPSGATAATATIGAALAAGGAAISIVNAHQLGKNWEQMSAAEKAGESAKLTGTVALAGVGGMITAGLATGSTMAVMPVVAIAGPAGLGAIATGNVIVGAYNGYKVAQAIKNHRKISKLERAQSRRGKEPTKIEKTLLTRAKRQLTSEIKNRFIKIGILALTTVGLVLGAALIGGLMATPVGWIAAGIVLTGFVTMTTIMLSRYIYQRYKAKNQQQTLLQCEVSKLVAQIHEQNQNSATPHVALAEILSELRQQQTTHNAKSTVRHFAEIFGAKNREKAAMIEQRKQLRLWFYHNLSLFETDTTDDAESSDPVILNILELNEDVLLQAAWTLVRETNEQQQ